MEAVEGTDRACPTVLLSLSSAASLGEKLHVNPKPLTARA